MPLNPTNQRIASNVRAQMRRQNLSQARLASNLGKAQDFVSRRLTCKVAFTIPELEAIAKALDVTFDDLVGDEAGS